MSDGTLTRHGRRIGLTTKSLFPFLLLAFCFAVPARAQRIEWARQLGTWEADQNWGGVSADGLGHVYISGYTNGNLGATNKGARDAFVSKFDAEGTLQWTQQLGTSDHDSSYGVSADGLGNVYISGQTYGALGLTNEGGPDAFLSKYDASGTLHWTQQLGTSVWDRSWSVSADGLGDVYISGDTHGNLEGTNAGSDDAFLSKYDARGSLQWTRQIGTSSTEYGRSVSADGRGSVYISGWTAGSLGGTTNAGGHDAYISKYDTSGTLQWTQQLGTSDHDSSYGVSADGLGSVYISGWTAGSLEGINAGDRDAFLSKYDANGNLQWTRQLGTSASDVSGSVSADRLGSVYISGGTFGSLGGTSAGNNDAFLSKYDASGTLLWTQQLGTSGNDGSSGVSADGLGNVYISGSTEGSLGGPRAGDFDVWVAKFFDGERSILDFNNDLHVDVLDVDALVGEIIAGTHDSALDLTVDGSVDNADLMVWLSDAATHNGFNAPYLLGDANLDGIVNAADLNALGQNWLGHPNAWQWGDFTADGTVDGSDLAELAHNWQASIPLAGTAVPESVSCVAVITFVLITFLLRRT